MWGIGLRWLRDRKVVEDYHILHGSEETDEYRLSPIRATIERGTPLQHRLARPVLGSRAQGVFGRASPAHDRPAKGSHATCMGGFPVKRLFLGFAASSLFGAGKAVLRPVACDQVPGARGRGQGTETLA